MQHVRKIVVNLEFEALNEADVITLDYGRLIYVNMIR